MNAINLLPWREWRRERARRTFFVNLGLSGVLAIAVILSWGWHLDGASRHMDHRNDYLRERILELDRRLAEIEELREMTDRVLSRLEVAQALQGNRQEMARVFDALAQTMADGAHYTSLSLNGNLFTANGAAASNERVSTLMRNIQDSRWFAEPNLRSISEIRDGPHYGGRASEFELTFRRTHGEGDPDRSQPPLAGGSRREGHGGPEHA
ncbi:MAG: PilN domain-containing protein [Gammaproteobacteria bacterium]|nr:PilN domain-containing protein [Gammaproteobacteria bacterium]